MSRKFVLQAEVLLLSVQGKSQAPERSKRGNVKMNLNQAIENRISVRKYESELFEDHVLADIQNMIASVQPLYTNIKTRLEFISGKSLGMGFLFGAAKINAPYSIAIVTEQKDGYMQNAGFIGEQMVLGLTDKGIGTCWLGTFDADRVKEAAHVGVGEVITNLIAVGYPFRQKNFRNDVLRAAMGKRKKSIYDIVFHQEWGKSSEDYLNAFPELKKSLQMAILAPSGGNRQPVSVVLQENSVNVYVKNKKNGEIINPWAEMDSGIFTSHVYLCMRDQRINTHFIKQPPVSINVPDEYSYVLTIDFT
jgi:nitroreductase